jgi:hypothetical protein
MKKEKKPLVLNTAKELYDHLGVSMDDLDSKSEFSIYNLADLPLKLPFTSAVYRANFFSLVFVKNSKGISFSDNLSVKIKT